MGDKTLEEYIEQLRGSDERSRRSRAERLKEKELEHICTDGRVFGSQREWDYAGEASDGYINGNYRSVIFCCACAVDQIFRYEYLRIPGNNYEDVGTGPFGKTIRKCSDKDIPRLRPLIEKSRLLNRMRNEVAAHPLFVDLPVESDPDRQTRNRLLTKDIKKLLALVESINPEFAREIAATTLVSEVEKRTYVFGEVVNGQGEMPYNLNGFWVLIQKDILQFLAGQAWHILKVVAEDLYPVTR